MLCKMTAVPKETDPCPDYLTCQKIRFEKPGLGMFVVDSAPVICAACQRVRARCERMKKVYEEGHAE